jgi:hypothetical protein
MLTSGLTVFASSSGRHCTVYRFDNSLHCRSCVRPAATDGLLSCARRGPARAPLTRSALRSAVAGDVKVCTGILANMLGNILVSAPDER